VRRRWTIRLRETRHVRGIPHRFGARGGHERALEAGHRIVGDQVAVARSAGIPLRPAGRIASETDE